MKEMSFENEIMEQSAQENLEANNENSELSNQEAHGMSARELMREDIRRDMEKMKEKYPGLRGSIYHSDRESLSELARKAQQEEADAEGSKEAHGGSVSHHKWEVETAIKNGNEIARKNAEARLAKAIVQQAYGESDEVAAEKTAEGTEGVKETHGGSADHHKWEMTQALASGNKIAFDNAKARYAEAVVKETYGESDEATKETAAEGTEVGKETHGASPEHYLHWAEIGVKNGNSIQVKNAINNYNNEIAKQSKKNG